MGAALTTLRRTAALLGCVAVWAVPVAAQAQANPAPTVAMKAAAPVDHFAAADTNGDGFVDLVEFQADILRGWHRLDHDGDGYITREEVLSIPHSEVTSELWQRMLTSADATRDGRLSFKEAVYARMDFFEQADANKDEKLSRAEVQAFDQRAARAPAAKRAPR